MPSVVVIYSRVSPQRVGEEVEVADEDTFHSAQLVGRTLADMGYEVSLREIHPRNLSEVSRLKADVVFNLCEWSGKDYMLGVEVVRRLARGRMVFTGADSRSYIWGSEKQEMKKMFGAYGIPTPRWWVYRGGGIRLPEGFPYPAIAKPALEHCAIGIEQKSVVNSSEEAVSRMKELWRKFKQPILLEQFVTGSEYQVTVVERKGVPFVLPIAQINFRHKVGYSPLLTYKAKWMVNTDEDDLSEIGPYSGPKKFHDIVEKLCVKAWYKMRCRGYVRFDIRETDGYPMFLEVNVNPGLDWDPDYGMTISLKSAGFTFRDLIRWIVQSAVLDRDRDERFNFAV